MFVHVLRVRGNDLTALFEKLKDSTSNPEGSLDIAAFSKLLEQILSGRLIKSACVGVEPADRHINKLVSVVGWQYRDDLKPLPSYLGVL